MQIEIDQFSELESTEFLKKRDLKPSENLKESLNLINQHLYGKLKHTDTGTRARSKQIIFLLLCKLHDEVNKRDNEVLDFQIKFDEKKNNNKLLERIQFYFQKNIKDTYSDSEIFKNEENIRLNKELVYLIVSKIQNISLLESSQDILSDVYEIFVSRSLKEDGGQFFTPPNVVKFIVRYLDPDIKSKIIDPACGHGGFLLESKSYLYEKIIDRFKGKKDVINKQKISIISNLYGIDKDSFLAKVSRLYLEILSNGNSNIFCEDSLDPDSYHSIVSEKVVDNSFDFVFTNPPFGVKIPIDIKNILEKYELAHVWKKTGEKWEIQRGKLVEKQPPQILFIERCVQLLKEGGKLGIVLPEGIFGNPSDRYIWEYLYRKGKILGIVSLDQNTFQPYTCNKTSILFFQKSMETSLDYNIDFAIVENVGHDKDGKVLYKLEKDGSKKKIDGKFIVNDDLEYLDVYLRNSDFFDYSKEQKLFKLNSNQIKNKIYIPSYYTGVEKTLKKLENDDKFILTNIKKLTKQKIIYTNKGGYIPRGAEIGSQVYGLGDIPFIRTSEFFNWEVKLDSNKKTSEEVFEQYRERQNIEEGDILLVKDGGPNLIGSTAYITELDTKIIIQSHIYQFKVLENNEAIDSFLLLFLLNLDFVQKQIQAITFIQGTIATIGNRIMDVVLSIPKDYKIREKISRDMEEIIQKKVNIRKKVLSLSSENYL